VAALRIHQHGVDDVRIALPLPPRPLRPPRQIGGVAPLQHHTFDGIGVVASTRAGWIGARGGKVGPRGKRDRRRQVDAGIVELLHKGLELRAALLERQLA
jgi:hypothetical protein